MEIKLFITLGHIIGATLGVGGATASDLLFFRALKDKKISGDEYGLLKTLSVLLWSALFLLLVSGLAFFALQYHETGSIVLSERFLTKLFVYGILFTNAWAFHLYALPFLKKHLNAPLTLSPRVLGRLAIIGSISIVSWYTALFIGVFRKVPDLYYDQILAGYILILLLAIGVARHLILSTLKK